MACVPSLEVEGCSCCTKKKKKKNVLHINRSDPNLSINAILSIHFLFNWDILYHKFSMMRQ